MTNVKELCEKMEKDMKDKNVKAKVIYKESEQSILMLISLSDITEKLKNIKHRIWVEGNILKVKIENIRGD